MKNYPNPPEPPPKRLFKVTLFGGLIETEESKRDTAKWLSLKIKLAI